MDVIFSKDLEQGLAAASVEQKARRSRYRLRVGGQEHRLVSLGKDGFSLSSAGAPYLPGLVDIYEGERHLFQCLVMRSGARDGEVFYDFKRATPVSDRAPLDFVVAKDAPTALIESDL